MKCPSLQGRLLALDCSERELRALLANEQVSNTNCNAKTTDFQLTVNIFRCRAGCWRWTAVSASCAR